MKERALEMWKLVCLFQHKSRLKAQIWREWELNFPQGKYYRAEGEEGLCWGQGAPKQFSEVKQLIAKITKMKQWSYTNF